MTHEERKRIRKIQWNKELSENPRVALWSAGKTPKYNASFGEPEPSMMSFLLPKEDTPRGCMLICPGGAYAYKAYIEGKPVAQWLNSIGISAFVLDYRTQPYEFPCPLLDIQRAIRLIRFRADEWGIAPQKIGVIGFSAGGHLSALASTHFDNGNPNADDPVEQVSSRPDVQVLCYPVISYMDCEKGDNLVSNINDELRRTLSVELNVRDNTPPAFLWSTRTDMLPYQKLFEYANALNNHGVSFELHIFKEGRHGLGLADDFPDVHQWADLCAAWLKGLPSFGKT